MSDHECTRWEQYIMAEIEVGHRNAVWYSSCADFSTASGYDQGITQMALWEMYDAEDAIEEGRTPSNEGPWGPWR